MGLIKIRNKSNIPFKIRYRPGREKAPAFVSPLGVATVDAEDIKEEYLVIGKKRGLIEFFNIKSSPTKPINVKKIRGSTRR